MAAFGDPPSIGTLHLFGRNQDRLLAMFTHREYRVSTSEVDNCERVGVWNVGSRWPLGDQHRGPEAVVIAAQEAGVRLELLDELSDVDRETLSGALPVLESLAEILRDRPL